MWAALGSAFLLGCSPPGRLVHQGHEDCGPATPTTRAEDTSPEDAAGWRNDIGRSATMGSPNTATRSDKMRWARLWSPQIIHWRW